MSRARLFINWFLVLACISCGGSSATSARGDTGPAGGSAAGGSGTTGGSGGGTGIGGSSVGEACRWDDDCGDMQCGPDGKCVECIVTPDCPTGTGCVNYTCVSATVCKDAADCSGSTAVCDPVWKQCVECAADTDCAAHETCVGRKCREQEVCMNSLNCTAGVCDMTREICVTCLADADCPTAERCVAYECVPAPPCASDVECRTYDLLCDPPRGQCVQCLRDADCASRLHCSNGLCTADVCEQGALACNGDDIARCNASGSGFEEYMDCPGERVCEFLESGAACTLDGACGPGEIDVVWVIDHALRTFAREFGPVIDTVHQNLKSLGASIRTILIAEYRDYACSGFATCVPPPTGSEKCPGSTDDFHHIPTGAYWMPPLWVLIDEAPKWVPLLREEARTIFVVASGRSDPEYTAATFASALEELPTHHAWRMHGVVCSAETCSKAETCSTTNLRCTGATPYLTLIGDTGGTAVDHCNVDPPATATPLAIALSQDRQFVPGCY